MRCVKVVWNWSHKLLQCRDIFSIASLHSLASYLSALAKVLPPGRTIVALEAGAKERLDANPITCFDLFYSVTQLFDNAHDFVARYYWQARRRAIFFQSPSIRCRFDLQTRQASISRISPVLPFIVGLSIDISLSGRISICASVVSTIARIFSAMEPLIPFLHLC